MGGLDNEWAAFLQTHNDNTCNFGLHLNSNLEAKKNTPTEDALCNKDECEITKPETTTNTPVCEELYISTKTKVLYLNMLINMESVF